MLHRITKCKICLTVLRQCRCCIDTQDGHKDTRKAIASWTICDKYRELPLEICVDLHCLAEELGGMSGGADRTATAIAMKYGLTRGDVLRMECSDMHCACEEMRVWRWDNNPGAAWARWRERLWMAHREAT